MYNTSMLIQPTPYPEVNILLQAVLDGARGVLGGRMVGMYLDGSLAGGGFDQDSDIDFVVVTSEDISGDLFLALSAIHERISALDSPWAIQLEGSYISREAVRRYDPQHTLHPNLERGSGERLKMANHDQAWAIHRRVLREQGITIVGPTPKALIDPVSADELRACAIHTLRSWASHLADHPEEMDSRGYQSYVVLSLCRILYTLQCGEVASKQAAARWVSETRVEKWDSLIDRAWVGRHQPSGSPDAGDVIETVALIRYGLEAAGEIGT